MRFNGCGGVGMTYTVKLSFHRGVSSLTTRVSNVEFSSTAISTYGSTVEENLERKSCARTTTKGAVRSPA